MNETWIEQHDQDQQPPPLQQQVPTHPPPSHQAPQAESILLNLLELKHVAEQQWKTHTDDLRARFRDLPLDTQKLFACLLYFQGRSDGQTESDTIRNVARAIGSPSAMIQRWQREYEVSVSSRTSTAVSRSDAPPWLMRPCRRGWLLDEYPELMRRTREWIQDQRERRQPDRDGRYFKITEFQCALFIS